MYLEFALFVLVPVLYSIKLLSSHASLEYFTFSYDLLRECSSKSITKWDYSPVYKSSDRLLD